MIGIAMSFIICFYIPHWYIIGKYIMFCRTKIQLNILIVYIEFYWAQLPFDPMTGLGFKFDELVTRNCYNNKRPSTFLDNYFH